MKNYVDVGKRVRISPAYPSSFAGEMGIVTDLYVDETLGTPIFKIEFHNGHTATFPDNALYVPDSTKVKVKKLSPEAVIPKYAKDGDAGMDLTATSKEWDQEKECLVFGTGLAFEIPKGYVGLVFPRSSICKVPLMLSNSVGVIDSGYRGEVKFFFRPIDRPRKNYEVGDRIGQIMIVPYPEIELVESEKLSDSVRGSGGFGSSGK
jgi:dUTP pyrophosphatase